MTPQRWERMKKLFERALDGAAEDQSPMTCDGDAELRGEVDALLHAHHRAAGFVERPVLRISAVRLEEVSSYPEQSRFGAYEVIRRIGTGGMGAVFLAIRADDEFRKQVAVKVIHSSLARESLVQRFRRERQILASLEHPNIARLIDGGATPEGLPYLVMEYVDGRPITRFIEEGHLTICGRLRLFEQVCGAVQFAHQNLIVHRDIKPGNILVTEDGQAKLLDFGISRLLDSTAADDHASTTRGMCTPEYASPEQFRGEVLSTRSDVYSLGVLLYELLTGDNPHRLLGVSTHDIVRAVCENEPLAPSVLVARRTSAPDEAKLRRELAGDLDNIVLKAMAKDPGRRYGSAEAIADDIRRWREGKPVAAVKHTLVYRLGKLLRRQKAAAIAAAVAVTMLVAGIFATAWQARVAEAQRQRAERRFADVRQLANSFLFEFHDAIETLPGATKARSLVVQRALQYLDSLAVEAAGDDSLRRELAIAYQRVGDVQGRPLFANLGDTPAALASFRKSETIWRDLVSAHPEDRQNQRGLLVIGQRIGDTLLKSGDAAASLEYQRASLVIAERLASAHPATEQALRDLVISHDRMGNNLGAAGDKQGALKSFRQALVTTERLAAAAAPDARRALLIGHTKFANLLAETGDVKNAMEHYRRAQQVAEERVAAEPANGQARRDLSIVLGKAGLLLVQARNFPEGLAVYRRAQTIAEELATADPDDVQAQNDLAEGFKELGEMVEKSGDVRTALVHYGKAARLAETAAAKDSSDRDLRVMLADIYANLGRANAHLKRLEEASRWYGKSLEVWDDLQRRLVLAAPESGRAEAVKRELARVRSGRSPGSLQVSKQ